jgi:tetratricopeptide (TPR) repeat protein
MQLNQFAEADAAYGMSLQIARSLAYEAKVMAQYITYYSMGRLAAERGYYDAAVSHYQQSLDLRRAIGHQERVSEVLYVMALALKQVGDDQGAFAVINESIATQQERNAIQEQAILERAQRLQDELRLNLAEKPK